jgi:hypothetical protein
MNKFALLMVSSLLYMGKSSFSQFSDSATTPKAPKMVQRITYYPATYHYVPTNNHYISGFALGMDYTQERFNPDQADMAWDSSDMYTSGSGGFNIYGLVMPNTFRNLMMKSPNMGSFNWGFGFNFNQFHRSREQKSVINTIRQDSVLTRIESSSVSLYTMARYEWRWGVLHPFVGVQAGASIISADQISETIIAMTEYESRTSRNLHTVASAYFAPEFGARIRLTPRTSLVASYELKMGSPIKLSDLNNTQFDGIAISAPQHEVAYQTGMWKFGILFDLSENKQQREVDKEAYYDTAMVDENAPVVTPCTPCAPCAPCPTVNSSSRSSNKSDMETIKMDQRPMTPNTNPSPTIPHTIQMPKKAMPPMVVPTPPKKKS